MGDTLQEPVLRALNRGRIHFHIDVARTAKLFLRSEDTRKKLVHSKSKKLPVAGVWRRNFFSVKVAEVRRRAGWMDEVSFGGFPMVGSFREEGGDQAEEGGFVWKDPGEAGAAFDFLIEPFEGIAGAQAALVGGGKGEAGEAFWNGVFEPGGKFWGGDGVGDDEFRQTALGAAAPRPINLSYSVIYS